jgi:hypothetical protein
MKGILLRDSPFSFPRTRFDRFDRRLILSDLWFEIKLLFSDFGRAAL